MKKVGVIGGMGPQATLDFLDKIIACTTANCDQDHIPLIIDIVPQIPDRSQYLLGTGENPLPYLLESSVKLVNSGAAALCMPCNTAHAFLDDIRDVVSVPFISIVESTLEKILCEAPLSKRIALLATTGTVSSGVYHNAFGKTQLQIMPLTSDFQNRIMNIIYGIKRGHHKKVIPVFQDCIDDLGNKGADVIIAGCTELPLLVPHISALIPIIDPTHCLAENVVKFARGEREAVLVEHRQNVAEKNRKNDQK